MSFLFESLALQDYNNRYRATVANAVVPGVQKVIQP